MLEKDFCTIIGHSLDWSHKISDFGGKFHGDLPFDQFGIYKGKPIYIEAKWMKEPMSFNWNRLEEHQLGSLMEIKKLCPEALCWILIGCDFGRNDKRVFLFDDLETVKKRKEDKDNILKKELVTLPFFPIKKGKILF